LLLLAISVEQQNHFFATTILHQDLLDEESQRGGDSVDAFTGLFNRLAFTENRFNRVIVEKLR